MTMITKKRKMCKNIWRNKTIKDVKLFVSCLNGKTVFSRKQESNDDAQNCLLGQNHVSSNNFKT